MGLAVLGYLLSIVNPNALGGQNMQLKDVGILVQPVTHLKEALTKYPEFKIEDFKDTSYARKGDIGLFVSKNFHDYLFNKDANLNEDGVLLTLYFDKILGAVSSNSPSDNRVILLSKAGLDDSTSKAVIQYIDEVHKKSTPGIYMKKIHAPKA